MHKGWLLAGLAMAVLPLGAMAQAQQAPAGPSLGAWPTTTAPADPRPPRLAQPPSRAADNAPVAPIRRADPDASEPAATESSDAEPREVQPPQDGVLEPTEAPAQLDGLDPSTVDARPSEDVEPFTAADPAEPPAGYDPSQFTIEPEPILDPRPQRLTRLDPYVPVGIRVGSFILYPETEIAGNGYSNVFRSSSDPKSDVALDVRPALRAVSTWGVHGLELGARGAASFHNDFPSEDDRAWAVDARGRLDVTRRTKIETVLSREVAQEARGTVNARSGPGDRSDITTDRAEIAASHRFNRLTVQLRGGIIERDYTGTTGVGGAIISNDDRDVTQREAAVRASWEFKPTLSAFAEVGGDDRSYRAATLSDNLKRDSSGERYRAGISFGNTSQVIRGEVSIGTARQHFESGLPDVSGVVVDANVGWRITGLTSLLLTARSDVGESTLAGSGGALVRSGGAELRHAFRRNLVGSAGLRLTRADYAGVDLVERDVTAYLGVEHYLSREVTLFGRYQHIDFESTNIAGNYNADEVRIGVRVRR